MMSIPDAGRRKINLPLLVESLVIMTFAAAMYGLTYTFDRVPPILAQGVQPTAFPRAVLIIMFVLAGLQAYRATALSGMDNIATLLPLKPVPLIVILSVGLLILFALAMPRIGTFPTLALFCPGLALLWGERRWSVMALSFAGFITFIYLLFRILMNVPLP